MKDRHIEITGDWPLSLYGAAKSVAKSVTRGIGPPRQSDSIDIEKIHLLDIPWDLGIKGFPVGSKQFAIVGTFYMTREIELSLAMRSHVIIADEKYPV